MRVGYCRTSKTQDQSLDLQIDALKAAKCEKIFSDQESGTVQDRKGLNEALAFVRRGDEFCVWRLDRIARSLQHLIQVVNQLNEKGVAFVSLQENVDTTSASGKFTFHLFGALAEFERSLLRERTMAGLAAARARGRLGGRPAKMDAAAIEMARTLMANVKNRIPDICKTLGVSRATLYRTLRLNA